MRGASEKPVIGDQSRSIAREVVEETVEISPAGVRIQGAAYDNPRTLWF